MKLNKEFIKQLRNGEIAAENNGTLEQLTEVLKAAFPKYHSPRGGFIFYFMDIVYTGEWIGNDKTTLPVKKISDFYQPELFTGWAKDDRFPKWMAYFKEGIRVYGFDGSGVWYVKHNRKAYSSDKKNRPATNEEIEKHLIQEAKRRGYKGGGTIKGIDGTTYSRPGNIWLRYHPEDDRLLTNVGCIVYERGQWAEIVEKPQPKKSTSLNYLKEVESPLAFPLRDYFAGKAMQAIITTWNPTTPLSEAVEYISIESYKMADAMLQERNKSE